MMILVGGLMIDFNMETPSAKLFMALPGRAGLYNRDVSCLGATGFFGKELEDEE